MKDLFLTEDQLPSSMFNLNEYLTTDKCKRKVFNALTLYHMIKAFKCICNLLSEIDDEDCERRRMECLDEMSDLEKQFLELKEK